MCSYLVEFGGNSLPRCFIRLWPSSVQENNIQYQDVGPVPILLWTWMIKNSDYSSVASCLPVHLMSWRWPSFRSSWGLACLQGWELSCFQRSGRTSELRSCVFLAASWCRVKFPHLGFAGLPEGKLLVKKSLQETPLFPCPLVAASVLTGAVGLAAAQDVFDGLETSTARRGTLFVGNVLCL